MAVKAAQLPPDLHRMIHAKAGAIRSRPEQWCRGEIIEVRLLQTNASQVEEIWGQANIHVIPAFSSFGIAVTPIRVEDQEQDLELLPFTMKLYPEQHKSYTLDASKQELFVDGNWRWKDHAYINISDQRTVSYQHMLKKLAKLEPRSTALVLQRYRIFHNMAYVPPNQQHAYFKAMMTREPVFQPEPNGEASIEFLVTTTGAYNAKDSLSSEVGDMLIKDLGWGVERGHHDMEAAQKLISWKPSLKYLLSLAMQANDDWEYSPLPSPEFATSSSLMVLSQSSLSAVNTHESLRDPRDQSASASHESIYQKPLQGRFEPRPTPNVRIIKCPSRRGPVRVKKPTAEPIRKLPPRAAKLHK